MAAAGGYGPRVDAERAGRELNLAAPLHDGDQVRVPSRDDAAVGDRGGAARRRRSAAGGAAGPIDLNRATAARARRAARDRAGRRRPRSSPSREEQPFAAVEDLRTRKLVGEKTFEELKDLVTVR